MAIKKASFKFNSDNLEEQPKPVQLGHGKCAVFGCPRSGHINTGVWNCRYHWNKNGDQLSFITMKLKNHEAEINWYEKLITATVVDYAVKDVHKKALNGLEPLQAETFQDYRERITSHINKLLSMPESQKDVTVKSFYDIEEL